MSIRAWNGESPFEPQVGTLYFRDSMEATDTDVLDGA